MRKLFIFPLLLLTILLIAACIGCHEKRAPLPVNIPPKDSTRSIQNDSVIVRPLKVPGAVIDSVKKIKDSVVKAAGDTLKPIVKRPVTKPKDHNTVVPDKPNVPDTAPAQTILGYSYFKKIAMGSSKAVNVFITSRFGQSKLIDTLHTVTLDETFKEKNDTPTIGLEYFQENFAAFDSVDVRLTDPGHSFHIDTIGASRQPVLQTSRWTWEVTPITEQAQASLIINAIPRRKNGSSKFIQPRTIIIEIEITQTFFRKLWIFINNNPWTIMTIIIIPVVAFFGKRLLKSKDE